MRMSETKFADIQQILDEAVEFENIGRHGPFWRGVTRDEFVAKSVFGCPIIHSEGGQFVGPRSPLVMILRGPIQCGDSDFPQMPAGFFQPVDEAKVQTISSWIDAQCPE